MPNFNKNIRNSIGHESWIYIPFDYKILFKNEKGTITDEMYLLEFVYECWNLAINCISIYKVIQDVKRHHELLHTSNN